MIDYRTKMGKMIDKNSFIVECIKCGRKIKVNNPNQIPNVCSCSHKDTFVIREDMSVITKGV